ncbi:MAG: SHOCT domain-containing protein [Planctomycetota bacterium]
MPDRIGPALLAALPDGLWTALAQSPAPAPAPNSATSRILLWLIILAAATLFLGVTCYILWKRLTREDREPTISTGFTLPDLRDLHRSGQLTDEEFENAKAMLLARSRAEMAADEAAEDAGEPDFTAGNPPR